MFAGAARLLVLFSTTGLLCGAGTTPDVKQLQGTWNLVSAVRNGQKSPEEKAKGEKVIIKGNTIAFLDTRAKQPNSMTFKLDPAKKPKRIDMATSDPDLKPVLGIYELNGDVLRLCIRPTGGKRPTQFSAAAGSACLLFVLKRTVKSRPKEGGKLGSEEVLYVSSPKGRNNFDVFVMKRDRSPPRALTGTKAIELDPVFPPDYKRIAFVVFDPKRKSANVFVMNADGSARRRITMQADSSLAVSPGWSPNGNRIVYSVRHPGCNDWELYAIDADGKNRNQLTKRGGILPAWSPDGETILYTVRDFQSKRFGINVMDADGKNAKVLLKGNAWMGVWSPDGKRIACVADVGKTNAVIIMNADGSNPRSVVKGPGIIAAVQWSKYGNRLYFAAFRPTHRQHRCDEVEDVGCVNGQGNPSPARFWICHQRIIQSGRKTHRRRQGVDIDSVGCDDRTGSLCPQGAYKTCHQRSIQPGRLTHRQCQC